MRLSEIPAIKTMRRMQNWTLREEECRTIFCVYAISDPRDDKVKYVGKSRDLEARFRHHVARARNKPHNYVERWIAELFSLGLYPSLQILQLCFSEENAYEAEAWWIHEMIRRNQPILNKSTQKGSVLPYSRVKEDCEKLHAKQFGRRVSHATRQHMSGLYRKLTQEQILEMKSLRPEVSYSKLASRFNVCIATAYNAVNDKFYGEAKGTINERT